MGSKYKWTIPLIYRGDISETFPKLTEEVAGLRESGDECERRGKKEAEGLTAVVGRKEERLARLTEQVGGQPLLRFHFQ